MTIKRVVNGVEMEFKLTPDELYDAYCEQEHNGDIAICESYFHAIYYCEEWYKNLNKETENNIIEDAAYEFRKNIEEYNMDLADARIYAFADVIDKYIKEA